MNETQLHDFDNEAKNIKWDIKRLPGVKGKRETIS